VRAAAAAALGVLLLGLAWPAFQTEATFEATHFDSRPDRTGYHEVWCVTRAPTGWDTANVTATLDGTPIALAWEPAGPVRAGSRFGFEAAERDVVHALAVAHRGEPAWSVEFGAGAGTPVGCGR
jgi:hypothetical protein